MLKTDMKAYSNLAMNLRLYKYSLPLIKKKKRASLKYIKNPGSIDIL